MARRRKVLAKLTGQTVTLNSLHNSLRIASGIDNTLNVATAYDADAPRYRALKDARQCFADRMFLSAVHSKIGV